MKNLPIGLQDFEKIIRNNYLYVDKTKVIYEMINRGMCYFFSRPRRFGKSVLISTLEALFANKKELFKGLWIEQSPYVWQKHPIIRLDFSAIPHANTQELERGICKRLKHIAQEYGIDLAIEQETRANTLVTDLIIGLAKRNSVVILIDEYDKPILDVLHDGSATHENQKILASFYAALKAADQYIRFIFITGIGRISRTSLFSGLNNLNDITFRDEYAYLVGYSPEELAAFAPYIEYIATTQHTTANDIVTILRDWYNGFRFSYSPLTVYNPFSIIRYLESGVLANYWFESATPSFLVHLIKKNQYTFDGETIAQVDGSMVSAQADKTYPVEKFPIIPLLFQTGYLTIKEYIKETNQFVLTYPNREVRESFLTLFAQELVGVPENRLSVFTNELRAMLESLDFKNFFDVFKTFFAGIPYEIQIPLERYYQSLFYVILKLIGADIIVEKRTNIGRIDAVIETKNSIIITEFKIDGSAEDALQQILDKKYYESYLHMNKEIILLGVSFSTQNRNIDEWSTMDLI